jgi:hypothetical protein
MAGRAAEGRRRSRRIQDGIQVKLRRSVTRRAAKSCRSQISANPPLPAAAICRPAAGNHAPGEKPARGAPRANFAGMAFEIILAPEGGGRSARVAGECSSRNTGRRNLRNLKEPAGSAVYSVRGTTARRCAAAVARNLSRIRRNSEGGNGPYANRPGSVRDSGRKSGPGQQNRLTSLTTTQERASSKPSRRFTACGISTASPSASGAVCVIGSTVTVVSPDAARAVRITAQGRVLSPSSCPFRKCECHR